MTPHDVANLIREIAIAEETWAVDHDSYVAFTQRPPAGFAIKGGIPAGVRAGAALVGAEGYCIAAYVPEVDRGLLYDSTRGGFKVNDLQPQQLSPGCRIAATHILGRS